MTGTILRGIGSFYTVKEDETGEQRILRAKKKFRRERIFYFIKIIFIYFYFCAIFFTCIIYLIYYIFPVI